MPRPREHFMANTRARDHYDAAESALVEAHLAEYAENRRAWALLALAELSAAEFAGQPMPEFWVQT